MKNWIGTGGGGTWGQDGFSSSIITIKNRQHKGGESFAMGAKADMGKNGGGGFLREQNPNDGGLRR